MIKISFYTKKKEEKDQLWEDKVQFKWGCLRKYLDSKDWLQNYLTINDF
jgi:hypothetical protein